MKSVIINQRSTDAEIPDRLWGLLPYRVTDAIKSTLWGFDGRCEEIRLRCGGGSTLTVSGGRTISLGISLSADEMNETLEAICGGSLYAHGDTIKQGYVSLFGGMRAGVCGRAAIDNGRVIGVSDVSSICIRIPHFVNVDPSPVLNLLSEYSYAKGVLIYSPPGEGKTTLLRSVALEASRISDKRSDLRVAVIDTRGELDFGLRNKSCSADIFTGYPKSLGIEIALRTFNASLIICDEIGNEGEASSIVDASVGGAALVASAHAADISSLIAKKSIRLLHDHGVFGAYVGIRRRDGKFIYTVTRREEVIL